MRKYLIIGFLFVIALRSFAAIELTGFYVSNKNDTVKVVFKLPTGLFSKTPIYERMQCKIHYLDSAHKKQTLLPRDVKEISFKYNGQKVTFLTRNNELGLMISFFSDDSKIFLKLVSNGKMKLFTYY